jgi:ATP-dependent helicase HepA
MSAEHLLFRWYDEGLDAFRRNSSAAQRVHALQEQTLHDLLKTQEPIKIDNFIAQTRALAEQIETELHDGRDQLLEINSCRENIAHDLINQIKEQENKQTLWPYMEQLLECYGVEVEYHSPCCHILKPGNHLRISHFPELPEEGKTITVNREIALIREDMEFLTWEHPMVTAAMDLVLSSETGNAAISVVKHHDLKTGEYFLETLFIVECSAPADLQIGRFLPPTPIRILIDQHGNDFSTVVSHSSLLETGQAIEIAQMSGFLIDQRKHIEEILAIAENKAVQEMQNLVKQCCNNMLDELGSEIKRMSRLKKVNPNIKEQEVDQLKEITRLSYDSILSARLKLDAVRLIIST